MTNATGHSLIDVQLLGECLQTLGQATHAASVQFVSVHDHPADTVSWIDGALVSGPVPETAVATDTRHWLTQDVDASGPGRATWDGSGCTVAAARVDEDSDVLGAVVIARDVGTPWNEMELQTLDLFVNLVRRAVTADPERVEPVQRKLDDLVTQVATELMSISSATMLRGHQRTVRVLAEFFSVDTSFLRRNNHELGASILVAEWPLREDIPDPDPLGVVPFEGSDPVFAAIRDLREPLLNRPKDSPDEYQERVREGAGIPEVSLAMVPILHDGLTEGVLGFINFGDREWSHEELNALQTIASLLAQLQGRVDAEERLHHHAYHDELTGLPNRRALINRLRGRLDNPAEPPFPLFFIDLDRLKALNDFLGHAAGDEMLCSIADRLRDSLEPHDIVARLGGDEFVVVLGSRTERPEVMSIAAELLDVISQPLTLGDHGITRTACIGVAIGVPGQTSAEDLVRDADMAMLAAKQNGGNEALLFSETMREKIEILNDVELHLRSAIDDGALRLYFQPEYDLRSGQILSVEALVRWQHPTRGLLGPTHFIEVAEASNIIVDLGRWVLREACSTMAQWRSEFTDVPLSIRVNVSPVQLTSIDFVRLIATTLEENSLPGTCLCLEITERGVMRDVERVLSILHEIHSLGVTFAIDDFGTGSSSLAKLKELPVDVLKIDQSFIAELGMNPQDRAIVESIIQIADTFRLGVVAEGVETTAAVEELLKLGCHRAQGFLLQRPMPAAQFRSLLAHPHLNGATPWRTG